MRIKKKFSNNKHRQTQNKKLTKKEEGIATTVIKKKLLFRLEKHLNKQMNYIRYGRRRAWQKTLNMIHNITTTLSYLSKVGTILI